MLEQPTALKNGIDAPADPPVAAIQAMLAQLVEGESTMRLARTGQDDAFDSIVDLLNKLAEQQAARQIASIENERRFEEFLDVISGLAALDFSKKAHVGEQGTIIDAMAYGINTLSEELAATTMSRADMNNVLESMLDALVVADEYGTIKTVNNAASRLFGYAKEALVYQPINILFNNPDITAQVLDTVKHETGTLQIETTCTLAGGRVAPVSLAGSAMNYANNDLQGIVCIIRDISERKQAEEVQRRNIAQEETIRAQAAALAELSTPLIPISEQIVVMPLIGAVDSRRAQQVLETLLQGIAATGVDIAILDITGVPIVDTQVANALLQAAQSAKLLGARVMLTGIRPEVAQTLVGLGADLRGIVTHGTLQSGIAAVLRSR
jgi:rsbT co-antagonist protein RsbR